MKVQPKEDLCEGGDAQVKTIGDMQCSLSPKSHEYKMRPSQSMSPIRKLGVGGHVDT